VWGKEKKLSAKWAEESNVGRKIWRSEVNKNSLLGGESENGKRGRKRECLKRKERGSKGMTKKKRTEP